MQPQSKEPIRLGQPQTQRGISAFSSALPAFACPFAIIAISDIIDGMASIIVRRLPENTKRRLRIRAARNGRSMEQEARELLEAALARTEPKSENLGEII